MGFLRLRALYERLSHSLFALPALFVLLAVVLAQVVTWIDSQVVPPALLTSTVDNARAVLAAIAGGTITAASVVFSLTLVAVQLSSSQYSPRTLDTFLGDRFQQVVFGIVLGTFTYALLVLNAVEAPRDGEEVVPAYGTVLAVALAIASLVAVIASINHTAQSLRVASIANRITEEVMAVIDRQFGAAELPPLQAARHAPAEIDEPIPDDAWIFGAPSRGWVQQISPEGLLEAAPEGTVVQVVATAGDYLHDGQPVAHLDPVPADVDGIESRLRRAIVVGPHRTLQEDVAFGLIQLVDIAVKALSPGINDPHTAQEILARLGAVLTEIAVRDLAPARLTRGTTTLVRRRDLSHDDYFTLAVEPVRRCARTDPQVAAAVLTTLATVRDEALRRRADAHLEGVTRQAGLLMAELDLMATDADRRFVREVAARLGLPGRDRVPPTE